MVLYHQKIFIFATIIYKQKHIAYDDISVSLRTL